MNRSVHLMLDKGEDGYEALHILFGDILDSGYLHGGVLLKLFSNAVGN